MSSKVAHAVGRPRAGGARDADLAALARTLPLDEAALDPGATIRPGTLVVDRPTVRESDAPAPERTRDDAAALETTSLPRLDVSVGAGAPASSLEPAPPGGASGSELVLTAMLGEGGMGVVWLAHQRSLRRDVAVKQLRSGSSARSASGQALLAEARATGALEHPSIVPIHALGLDAQGSPLLVMKRVEGASLATLLSQPGHAAWADLERRHGDRLAAQLEILGRVADALELAHSRGFVHRDVKPENVMVGSFGEVYLLDWGLALQPGALSDEERASLSIVGTPAFLAPEMTAGDPSRIDARTDVYLLGATLHAVLTGRPRHEGTSLRAIFTAAVLSEPVAYDAAVPAELAALANDATAADPACRPQTAAAFRERLVAFGRHRGSLRLAEDARARLAAVLARRGAGPDVERASMDKSEAAALVECRFGFTQALLDWPHNEVARAGLRDTILALARAELRRRSPDAAEELARELDPPDPVLRQGIEALRAELAESKRFEERARAEVRERDPRVGARVGVLIQSGLILGMAGLGAHGALFAGGSAHAPASEIALWAGGLLVAAVATLAIFRDRALANRHGRQMSALLVVVLAAFAAAAWLVAARGGSAAEASAHAMAACAGVMGTGAIALDRRLGLSAVAAALAALACHLRPAIAPLALGLAGVVSVAVFLPESIRNSRGGAPEGS